MKAVVVLVVTWTVLVLGVGSAYFGGRMQAGGHDVLGAQRRNRTV